MPHSILGTTRIWIEVASRSRSIPSRRFPSALSSAQPHSFLIGRKRFSVLRDPVHGDIYLSDEEVLVVDTPEFQRLRGVRQLGAAYLVFPGALHTRFEHSIGTLHVTSKLIDAVNLNFELDPARCLSIAPEEARVIRMAALLHDVTHIPFGHNIEDQSGILERHDSPARYREMLSTKTELGRVLERLGLRTQVLAILCPMDPEIGHSVPPYWSQVLSDTICSDILDYLARDAYFTGLRLTVDERLINYFKVDRKSGNLFIDLTKREFLREDILSEIVRMLEARYYFSERVYYHHAKVSAGALVARATELVLGAGLIEERELWSTTDESLLNLLAERAARGDAKLARRVRDLVDRLRKRRLLKRACVFPRYDNEDVQQSLVTRFFSNAGQKERQRTEERIADLVRFATGQELEVIVYCPAARMQLKEVATHVRWPGAGPPSPLGRFADRVPRLADLERSYRDLWKFYVLVDSSDPAVLRKVQEIAGSEFEGARNAYMAS